MSDFKEIIDECVARKDFYNADRMKQVYLEYRRVNNIFEVGDKVVCGPLMDISNEILIIVEIKGSQLMFDNGWDIQSNLMRHATNEEIAAGHRL